MPRGHDGPAALGQGLRTTPSVDHVDHNWRLCPGLPILVSYFGTQSGTVSAASSAPQQQEASPEVSENGAWANTLNAASCTSWLRSCGAAALSTERAQLSHPSSPFSADP